MGIEVMLGMFEGNERAVAESIVEDRSFIIMLKDEAQQAAANAVADGDS